MSVKGRKLVRNFGEYVDALENENDALRKLVVIMWNTLLGDDCDLNCKECEQKTCQMAVIYKHISAMDAHADDYKQAAEYWQRMYEETFAERTCRDTGEDEWHFVCSACGYEQNGYECWNYCPNCGAKVLRNTPKYSETGAKVVGE